MNSNAKEATKYFRLMTKVQKLQEKATQLRAEIDPEDFGTDWRHPVARLRTTVTSAEAVLYARHSI